MGEHLTEILKGMCERVGADFDSMDFKKEKWFHDYTWTKEQEAEFKEWMTGYLYFDKTAREEILYPSFRRQKYIKAAVDSFILNYGWKLNEEECRAK